VQAPRGPHSRSKRETLPFPAFGIVLVASCATFASPQCVGKRAFARDVHNSWRPTGVGVERGVRRTGAASAEMACNCPLPNVSQANDERASSSWAKLRAGRPTPQGSQIEGKLARFSALMLRCPWPGTPPRRRRCPSVQAGRQLRRSEIDDPDTSSPSSVPSPTGQNARIARSGTPSRLRGRPKLRGVDAAWRRATARRRGQTRLAADESGRAGRCSAPATIVEVWRACSGCSRSGTITRAPCGSRRRRRWVRLARSPRSRVAPGRPATVRLFEASVLLSVSGPVSSLLSIRAANTSRFCSA